MGTPQNNYWLAQFRSGSRDGLEHFYDRHLERVYLYLLECTGDRSFAEDKSRVVFVVAHKERRNIKTESQLWASLFLIAKNLAEVYLREKGRIKDFQVASHTLIDTQVLTPEDFKVKESKVEILMALRPPCLNLPAKQRRIVVLYCWHKRSINEIASRLGTDVETIKSELSQCIVILKKSLDGRWEETDMPEPV